MFIFTKAFDRLKVDNPEADNKILFVRTFADVGPSITAAAVSEVLAFALGATTKIPALQQFCAVAALAVGIDFVFQLTWFTAGFALDLKRQDAQRVDLCPCVRYRCDREAALKGGNYVKRAIANVYIPFLFHPVVKLLVVSNLIWLSISFSIQTYRIASRSFWDCFS